MAHSLSATKRIRQNQTRHKRNRARKSAVKSEIRKFTDAVKARDLDKAKAELSAVYKKLDQTAAKGTFHKQAAARKKSRLARQLNKLTEKQASS